jgi:hypothetical protein
VTSVPQRNISWSAGWSRREVQYATPGKRPASATPKKNRAAMSPP